MYVKKKCSKCKRKLPSTIEYFHKNIRTKDGLHGECKECRKNKKNPLEIKKKCLYCTNEFIAIGANRFRQKYCSLECGDRDYHIKKYIPIIHKKKCIYCKKLFETNRPEGLYCSTKCSSKYHYEKNKKPPKEKNCIQCGELFVVISYKKYCSEECRSIAHYERHKAYYSRKGRERNKKRKLEVLQHYSNSNIPFCNICKIEDIDILTIDHIYNNGAEHRKKMKGHDLYYELIKTDFPKGYQVLCRNCNYKKFIVYKKNERLKIMEKYYGTS